MARKLFLGAFAMMLVKLNSADQEENNVYAPYGQNGNNYMVPPATNQQQEQLGLPPSLQTGYNERYGTKNYLPPVESQRQFQEAGVQNLKLQDSQGGYRLPASNQFSGQTDMQPPLPPKSLNKFYNQGSLKLPAGNGLRGPDILPPPVPPSSNVFYSKDPSKLLGSNQLAGGGDFPPSSNALSQQDSFKLPEFNQLSGTGELPPPILPGSNAFNGQDELQLPGSNQLPRAEDFAPQVPPSMNALYGRDFSRSPRGSQLPGGGDLPPPVPPSLNTFNDQNAFKLPESKQMYGTDSQLPAVDPSIKIPYGNDVVALPPDNNQLGLGGWQSPVLPDLKIPYGEDGLVPSSSNTLSGDKSPDNVPDIDNGLKSSSKFEDDDSSVDIIQDYGFKDDTFDEDFNQEDSNYGSLESFDAYSSVLKGLENLGGADHSYSESEDLSYEVNVGNWGSVSDYDSYDGTDQGEISVDGSFSSSYFFSSQESNLQLTESEFVGIVIDKLQNDLPESSRRKREIPSKKHLASRRPFSKLLEQKIQISQLHFESQDHPGSMISDSNYQYSSPDSDSVPYAYSSYGNSDEYSSSNNSYARLSNISSDANSLDTSSDANLSNTSDLYSFYGNSESNSSYSDSESYPSYESYSYSAYSNSDAYSSDYAFDTASSKMSSDVNSSDSSDADLSKFSDEYPSYDSNSYSSYSNSDAYSSNSTFDTGSSNISSDVSSSDSSSDASLSNSSDASSFYGNSKSYSSYNSSDAYPSYDSYSYSLYSDSDEYSLDLGSESSSGPSSNSYSYIGSSSYSYDSMLPFPSDNDLDRSRNVSVSGWSEDPFLEGKDNKTTKNHSDNLIASVIDTLMGSDKVNDTSEEEFSPAENSNALTTPRSLGFLTATSTSSLLDKLSGEDAVGSSSYSTGAVTLGFGGSSNSYLGDSESSYSYEEPFFIGYDVVFGGESDQNKDQVESTVVVSTTAWIQQEENHAIDHNSFPPQGTAWKPSGTGNVEQETEGLYLPKTRFRPVGSTSRQGSTSREASPSSLAVYLIPVVLLVLLVFLVRSNSYFRSTPKVVIVDPESRNRDIDAKAKEIEPLLRESMEYKDEVN